MSRYKKQRQQPQQQQQRPSKSKKEIECERERKRQFCVYTAVCKAIPAPQTNETEKKTDNLNKNGICNEIERRSLHGIDTASSTGKVSVLCD